jgi:membrane protein DedA with SNARE-associated domain/rhodanese-related sulfurtransferase
MFGPLPADAAPIAALTSILVGSLGLPLPTFAVLIVAGSLLPAASAGLGVGGLTVLAGVVCALIGDVVWFTIGRTYGARILSVICRVSLSKDTCVRNTAAVFSERGLKFLLISRFLPGLSIVTSPLAGASGVPLRSFVVYDGFGALLWISVGLALGAAFADQIATLLLVLRRFGMGLGEVAVVAMIGYVAIRWARRWLLIRKLRMARVSVSDLSRLLAAGAKPTIVDVRAPIQFMDDPFVIPGARRLQPGKLPGTLRDIIKGVPRDHHVVVYCDCPNEASAAWLARQIGGLGWHNVHPLAGGMKAWRDAGLAVQPYDDAAIERTREAVLS